MRLQTVYEYWHKNGNRRFKPGKDPEDVRNGPYSIEADIAEYCCEDMESAWKVFVGFGRYAREYANA